MRLTPTSIKNNAFLELTLLETSRFWRVTKPKHFTSGLCSRRINLRKVLFLIDVGVKRDLVLWRCGTAMRAFVFWHG